MVQPIGDIAVDADAAVPVSASFDAILEIVVVAGATVVVARRRRRTGDDLGRRVGGRATAD